MQVLLALVRNRLVIDFADMLESWYKMGHVVRIHSVQLVTHGFNFLAIHLNLLFVIFQRLARLKKQIAKMFNINAYCIGVGTG